MLLLLLQVFASLYTLSRNRKTTDWRWTAARVVLEFLQVMWHRWRLLSCLKISKIQSVPLTLELAFGCHCAVTLYLMQSIP
jgi:hypothetical protein